MASVGLRSSRSTSCPTLAESFALGFRVAEAHPSGTPKPRLGFPVTRTYVERHTGERRRHHLHESVLQRAVTTRSGAPGSPRERARTRCGIPSPHTCSGTAATSGPSGSFLATGDVTTTQIYTHALNRGPSGDP